MYVALLIVIRVQPIRPHSTVIIENPIENHQYHENVSRINNESGTFEIYLVSNSSLIFDQKETDGRWNPIGLKTMNYNRLQQNNIWPSKS